MSVLVRVSRVLYALVLRLYPARLRRRFGDSMRADAARLVADGWERRGWAGAAGAWGRILLDAAVSLPRLWFAERDERKTPERRRMPLIDTLWDDLRSAARGLRRSPGLSAIVAGVVGLAFAGALMTLAVVDAYLVRGLPYPDADRLVAVNPGFAVPHEQADPAVVEYALTWDLDAFTLTGGDRPELVRGAWISPGYAEGFGLRLSRGRLFRAEEYAQGAPVAIVSHALWQRRFGGDADVLGRTVPVFASDIPDQAEVFTIVGVLSEDYWYHNAYSDLLVPLRRPNPLYMAVLRPGVPLPDAERALTSVALRAGAELPPEGVRLTRFKDMYTAAIRPQLTALVAAVVFVLLLACANVAVLLLIRGAAREHEFAVRRVMGAGAGRLARQALVEGLLLAMLAAGLGLLIAAASAGILAGPVQAQLQVGIPGGVEAFGLSGRSYIAAAVLTVLVGLVLGGSTAAAIRRVPLAAAVAEGSRRHSESRRHRRARVVLVGAEVSLSFALLVAAGLALRSARNLAGTDLGFEPRDRITAQVNLRAASYPEASDRALFFDRLSAEARALPGVEAASLISRVPFGWNFGSRPVESPDAEPLAPEQAPRATGLAAGPGLLEAMGVPLVRGRDLSARDRPGSARVAVISQRLAERLWPGQDPLDRRFREIVEADAVAHGADASPRPWLTVVGVAGDVMQQLGDEDAPDYYVPYAQIAPTSMTVVMRVSPGADSPIPALESAVNRLDPQVAVAAVLSLEDATRAALAPARFLAAVLVAFSGFALFLAVLGLYCLVAYAAARRSRDIAVRMALGAEAAQVVNLFLRESAVVTAIGIAAGLAGAALLARALASQLTGVAAWDPLTYAAVALLLGGAALVAAWLPARRAAAGDPVAVLRGD